jgi:transposase
MIRMIEDLSGDWRRLDERIEHFTEEIEALAHGTESCRQLMTVPGVAPVVTLTYRATIDVPARFRRSKSVGAVLGLTPVCTENLNTHVVMVKPAEDGI